jgi:hypothetical protein
MLLREIVAVYSENCTKRMNTHLCMYNVDLLTRKVCGTYSYHWALKSLTCWLELANDAFYLIGSAVFQCME